MLTQESAARKDHTSGTGAELQHRHFAFIAAVIKDLPVERKAQAVIADCFADSCSTSNPRFNRARFLKACGMQ